MPLPALRPVTDFEAPIRSPEAYAICRPRWEGVGKDVPKIDPCGGCPLYQPCVQQSVVVPGIEAYRNWIDSINSLAKELTSK